MNKVRRAQKGGKRQGKQISFTTISLTYPEDRQRDHRQLLGYFQIDQTMELANQRLAELVPTTRRDRRTQALEHRSHQMPMVLERHQSQKGLGLQMALQGATIQMQMEPVLRRTAHQSRWQWTQSQREVAQEYQNHQIRRESTTWRIRLLCCQHYNLQIAILQNFSAHTVAWQKWIGMQCESWNFRLELS